MIRRTIEMWMTAALGLAAIDTAAAQSRVELSGAYQWTRAAEQTLPFGWSADIGAQPQPDMECHRRSEQRYPLPGG